ncbi:organic solute transporter Ostalpha-domain-containing protein [Hyaloraphidium curvatum]|nr:organic solute transporter Ostalpha-domain-containing protein [Hyaloraphidium curvatum]
MASAESTGLFGPSTAADGASATPAGEAATSSALAALTPSTDFATATTALTDALSSAVATALTTALSSGSAFATATAALPSDLPASATSSAAVAKPTDSCSFYVNPAVFDPSTTGYAIHVTTWVFTIVFATVATVLSLHLIWKHFQYYYRPEFQRYIVRILLMVPIYSILSCISYRYVWYSVYLDVLRDAYEGFVLYSFYHLLLHYLGLTPEAQSARLSHISRRSLPAPLCCVQFNPSGKAFLVNCKAAILQYAVLRPTMAIVAVILEGLGLLCPDEWGVGYGQFWVTLINFTSCTIALYALVLFYVVTHEEIAEHKPLYKFISIKFVIFFSYWQSLFLSLLGRLNLIPESEYVSSANLMAAIQSFLICFEMMIAARLHQFAFPYQDFVPKGPGGENKRTEVWIGIKDSLNMRDFVRDVEEGPQLVEEGLRSAVGSRTRKASGNTNKDLVLVDLGPGTAPAEGPRSAPAEDEDDDDFGYDASRDPSKIRMGGGYSNLNQFGMTVAETEEVSRPARAATSATSSAVGTQRYVRRDPFSLDDSDEEEPQLWMDDDVPLTTNGGGKPPPPSIL